MTGRPAPHGDPVAVNRATYDVIAGDYHARTNRVFADLLPSVAQADMRALPLFAHHREPELTRTLANAGFAVDQVQRVDANRRWLILSARRTR